MIRFVLRATKTLLGLIFVLAGFGMLFLPGQGVLTILIGITLIEFPGKFALERWIVRQPPIIRSINWMRSRAGRPALIPPSGRSGDA